MKEKRKEAKIQGKIEKQKKQNSLGREHYEKQKKLEERKMKVEGKVKKQK